MFFQLEGARVNYEGQGICSVDTPRYLENGRKYPVVIAVHGSNRGAVDYEENEFYAEQKKIALKNNCVFGVISNRFDTWGTDDGLYNIKLFADHIIKNYPVRKKVILWATSAGGVTANRMVKEYPELVDFVIGTFPVYDLESVYSLNTCRVAWKSKSIECFKSVIKGKNPADFPESLMGHKYYITHGSADSAVPLEANSVRMKNDVGDSVKLQIIEGGVHSTSNFAFYGEAVSKAFEGLNPKTPHT